MLEESWIKLIKELGSTGVLIGIAIYLVKHTVTELSMKVQGLAEVITKLADKVDKFKETCDYSHHLQHDEHKELLEHIKK